MFSPIRRITETLTPKKIALGTALVLASVGGTYGWRVRDRLSQTNPRDIQSSLNVSESLKDSKTVRSLVNPRSHASKGDSHSIILSMRSRENVPSEKALLSAFVTGFFSGPIFQPESIALSLFSLSKLPPTSSILWGTFQVADIELSDSCTSKPTGSRADIVFGDSQGGFAGCHRFSVKRLDTSEDIQRGEIKFRLSLECLVCDPTSSKPKESKFLHKVHNNYSHLLFRDAVAHTKSRFKSLV
ncbi:uncharacterized protein TRIVIDRAFT_46245 [Trichoderma virens Gv29-8]|uniref:Uncharacterized protein n=1 Tax=Hypocrea virens (strain Gv29-8 / FGSC 10586) TaxID=413071 RepID=G9N0W6_HYPVG|nr:uncharacterized protein TRIVIDRAFT_46245 [Trichoderma virens Gv29-8]EHK19399.1 hypothetical protein TRIVIDRAFT_46245 [Trichoderma virens Gv29-8]